MVKRTYLAVIMSLSLILVSFASVTFAAGGGSGHESHTHEMASESHHQMASSGDMMDCPAHHDGHRMKDAQCAVACFTMLSAVGWHGLAFVPLAITSADDIAIDNQLYKTRTLHIPTPPPNLA